MNGVIETILAKQDSLLVIAVSLIFILFVIKRKSVAFWFSRRFKLTDYDALEEEELLKRANSARTNIILGIITLPLLLMSPMAADNPSYGKYTSGFLVVIIALIPLYFLASGIYTSMKVHHIKQKRAS